MFSEALEKCDPTKEYVFEKCRPVDDMFKTEIKSDMDMFLNDKETCELFNKLLWK